MKEMTENSSIVAQRLDEKSTTQAKSNKRIIQNIHATQKTPNDKNFKLQCSRNLDLVDPGKNRDRYDALKRILGRKKQVAITKQSQQLTLESCEQILNKCKAFYKGLYGEYINRLPEEIERLGAFEQVQPQELARAITLFNLSSRETYLFWYEASIF